MTTKGKTFIIVVLVAGSIGIVYGYAEIRVTDQSTSGMEESDVGLVYAANDYFLCSQSSSGVEESDVGQQDEETLPLVWSDAQRIFRSFQQQIVSKDFGVLATVESSEIVLMNTSYWSIKRGLDSDGKNTEVRYGKYHENCEPYYFITLRVDRYIVDWTGQFSDTLQVYSKTNGQGIHDGRDVNYYSPSRNVEHPIGEQAIYFLTTNTEKDILWFEGFSAKYSISEHSTVQSEFAKYVSDDDVTDAEALQIMSGNLTALSGKVIDRSEFYDIERTLPIPLDDALAMGCGFYPHHSTFPCLPIPLDDALAMGCGFYHFPSNFPCLPIPLDDALAMDITDLQKSPCFPNCAYTQPPTYWPWT